MNRNAVGWFEIYVKDMDRARKFYEAVFGVKLVDHSLTDPDLARRRRFQAGNHSHSSRLSTPGGAKQDQKLLVEYFQVKLMYTDKVTPSFADFV